MNQKPLFLATALIALLVIAGAFWYLQYRPTAMNQPIGITDPIVEPVTQTEPRNPIDTSDWKTYRNEEYGFEYGLPNGGRIEFMGPPEPSIQGISVFHIYSGIAGEGIIILSVYDRQRQSPDERASMIVFSKDFEEETIGETHFRIQRSPYLNEEGGRYEIMAWTENASYGFIAEIGDSIPDSYHGKFALEYVPTFPNKEFYLTFLSKFRVFTRE
ncbi:MAG: hypothetical protein WBP40_01375 [Candidatus Moraniibacteriota bacterium]